MILHFKLAIFENICNILTIILHLCGSNSIYLEIKSSMHLHYTK